MRAVFSLFLASYAIVWGQVPSPKPELPGRRADGTVLLPNQWLLRPVGKQIVVGDFPVNIALHPEGKYAAILHCGYGQHEVQVVDLTTSNVVSRTNVKEAFYGLAFSGDGQTLLCSGATEELIHRFQFTRGSLVSQGSVALREEKQRGIPSGIALAADGRSFYAANLWAHTISRVTRNGDKPQLSELALDEKPLPITATPQPATTTDDKSITKRADALLESATGKEPFPYALLLDESRGRLYASLWAQAKVAVIDLASFQVSAKWTVEEHPNEMVLSKDGKRLFVANANRNSVSVLDTDTGKVQETLIATLTPGDTPGNTPNSLAISPDGEFLYVANANINTVAVFEVEEVGKSRSMGFIPVGWYPTCVRVTPDGKKLLVANGKGLISTSNRNGPRPGFQGAAATEEYIGGLFDGTLSIIDLPQGEKLKEKLEVWSVQAYSCVPQGARKLDPASLKGHPVPTKLGDPSPIKYVIYVVKENRTYDQVLGDMKEGNGDPSICLFPEAVTPNHHALARQFVLLDNFYVESEVSADGHEWSMGAYASDFVEKTWPLTYGHDKKKKLPYPSEGNLAIATPAGGYLWDRAKEAGVSYRSYGEWVANGKTPADPATAKSPALEGNFDPHFRSFDMDYPDVKRTEQYLKELKQFEKVGEMPRLQIVRLPNDHTSGASPGKPTPTAHVGDNDLAFGRLVEGISKSKFWPQTAIFVVEDDAQNGSDHVDAHRTIAYAISPYIKRGSVDSTLYSTSSMLRTMELILGLKPMSQFDAAAMPMFACFQSKPDPRPYEAREVTVDLDATNAKTAYGAEASAKMNFAKEDAADDLLLNEIIWRNLRGADNPMPAPRRAAFVFTKAEDEEEDEK